MIKTAKMGCVIKFINGEKLVTRSHLTLDFSKIREQLWLDNDETLVVESGKFDDKRVKLIWVGESKDTNQPLTFICPDKTMIYGRFLICLRKDESERLNSFKAFADWDDAMDVYPLIIKGTEDVKRTNTRIQAMR